MILTLHQYKTDFAHKNWVNMGVDSKNDVFGRILHLFVMPPHILSKVDYSRPYSKSRPCSSKGQTSQPYSSKVGNS